VAAKTRPPTRDLPPARASQAESAAANCLWKSRGCGEVFHKIFPHSRTSCAIRGNFLAFGVPFYAPDDLLSLTEAGRVLRVARQTIQKLVRSGKLKTERKTSGRPGIRFAEIVRYQHSRSGRVTDARLRSAAANKAIDEAMPDADGELTHIAYPDRRGRK
jgi:hypothetical protein